MPIVHFTLAALESALAFVLWRSTLSLFTPMPNEPGETTSPFALYINSAGPKPPYGTHSTAILAIALVAVLVAAVTIVLASGRRILRGVAALTASVAWIVALTATRDWAIDESTWFRADRVPHTAGLVVALIVAAAGCVVAVALLTARRRQSPSYVS